MEATPDVQVVGTVLSPVPQGRDIPDSGEQGLSAGVVGVIVLGIALVVGLIGVAPSLLFRK